MIYSHPDDAQFVVRWGGFDESDDGAKNLRLITREGRPGAVKPAVFQDGLANQMNGGTPNPRQRGWDVKRIESRSRTPRRGSPHTFNVPRGLPLAQIREQRM